MVFGHRHAAMVKGRRQTGRQGLGGRRPGGDFFFFQRKIGRFLTDGGHVRQPGAHFGGCQRLNAGWRPYPFPLLRQHPLFGTDGFYARGGFPDLCFGLGLLSGQHALAADLSGLASEPVGYMVGLFHACLEGVGQRVVIGKVRRKLLHIRFRRIVSFDAAPDQMPSGIPQGARRCEVLFGGDIMPDRNGLQFGIDSGKPLGNQGLVFLQAVHLPCGCLELFFKPIDTLPGRPGQSAEVFQRTGPQGLAFQLV